MKHLFIILAAFVFGGQTALASTQSTYGYGDSFIFVENGINFSVYPDGEFDFYIDRPQITAGIRTGNVSITFNSGYAYDPYVQYDAYGAVIQIENTPIYYDYYGRVSRIGSIDIYYQGNYLSRIGGLYIYFDAYGRFNRYAGFINGYNRTYVFQPFHRYFARPRPGYLLVDYRPYRRSYVPMRYTYYKPYVNNSRKTYARVGTTYSRSMPKARRTIYNNDTRVSRRNDAAITRSVATRNTRSTTTRSSAQPVTRSSSRNSRATQGTSNASTPTRTQTTTTRSSNRTPAPVQTRTQTTSRVTPKQSTSTTSRSRSTVSPRSQRTPSSARVQSRSTNSRSSSVRSAAPSQRTSSATRATTSRARTR